MRNLTVLPFILTVQFSIAQNDEHLTYVNESGQQVSKKNASFLIESLKTNDTLWTFNIYSVRGSMVRTFQTRDEAGTIRHGCYASYVNGRRDSTGHYVNNQKEGKWTVFAPGRFDRLLWQLNYHQDMIVSKKDSNEENANIARIKDSLEHLAPEVRGLEIECKFQDGNQGWQLFLLRHMHYPDEAVEQDNQGTVVIGFVVSAEGSVEDLFVDQSIEYSLDKEAMLMILASSGMWEPAQKKGRAVKSYLKQPIQFKLSDK